MKKKNEKHQTITLEIKVFSTPHQIKHEGVKHSFKQCENQLTGTISETSTILT